MRVFVQYARPVIQCSKCGISAEARLMQINKWVNSFGEIHEITNCITPDIPVGWISNGWKNGQRNFCCRQCSRFTETKP